VKKSKFCLQALSAGATVSAAQYKGMCGLLSPRPTEPIAKEGGSSLFQKPIPASSNSL
jgi:hypothetical protein